MNAIMVCVNYTDIAAITIPYNRHHFDELWVMTDNKSCVDSRLVQILRDNNCYMLMTDLFYADGAVFNKWRALEWALDQASLRKPGWLTLMDADVLWPKDLNIFKPQQPDPCEMVMNGCACLRGCLYSPLRRMWNEWPHFIGEHSKLQNGIPVESCWVTDFPVHRNIAEWAGYSQIFHTSDPVLGSAPWHQIDWKHCGGADSMFQMKWAPQNKIRPPFEVLHLGPAGQNWYGRATPLADGSVPPDATEKKEMVAEIWRGRAKRRAQGMDPFEPERIRKQDVQD